MAISDGPHAYADNAACRWAVRAAGPISLFIVSFEIEEDYDAVTVYAGEDEGQPPLYTLSGVLAPALLATNATSLTIEFAADSDLRFAGFVIELSTVQPGGTWAPSRAPSAAPTWAPASGAICPLAWLPWATYATVTVAGRVDSITFACDVGVSELCAGGTLEWSCAEHCPVGATACHMMLGSAGLTGTIPSAIADLSCASRLTYVYRPPAAMSAVRRSAVTNADRHGDRNASTRGTRVWAPQRE